ncbi:DUF6470 family protein [Amphibacillus jilinensis]|uniref:DUF6470 family protein n=1 Tax=Amphibacillus jilinensis TaxID=1216008 RepID=UPI0003186D36|nr:DUF6470 family protein [Amphibacillus jilinensis]
MRLPQVRLQSQQALISIETEHAQVQIQQPKATQEIQQPEAEVTINTTPSRLTIDQSQAWYDMGLKSVKQAHQDEAKRGYQKVLQGIARRVNDGNEQMKIENGGTPLISQAVRHAYKPDKQFNIGWIPSTFAVKTDYQPAEVDIRVNVNAPLIRNTPNNPIMSYSPGYARTGIRQENDLQVDFEPLVFRNFQFEMSI